MIAGNVMIAAAALMGRWVLPANAAENYCEKLIPLGRGSAEECSTSVTVAPNGTVTLEAWSNHLNLSSATGSYSLTVDGVVVRAGKFSIYANTTWSNKSGRSKVAHLTVSATNLKGPVSILVQGSLSTK
jgi:hypothetical protein